MTATKDQATVHARVLRVIADLPAIGKDSELSAPGMKFKYRGIEDVMRVLRPLLAEHGVHLVPAHRVVDDQRWETTQGNRSTRHRHVTLETTWTVWGADGDSFEAVTVSEGKDSADKALNKAMTASLKYAVLQVFAVADGDDDDDGDGDPSVYHHDDVRSAPTPLNELVGLKGELQRRGLYDDVRAWALQEGVDLSSATPDEDVQRVLDHARSLLSVPVDSPPEPA